jgi:hypothetical protein
MLKLLAREMNHDKYMLMEFLGPIVDGCRAALSVSVEKAQVMHQLSEEEFEAYMDSTEQSFKDITICFRAEDIDESHSLVFDSGEAYAFEDCAEPDVVLAGPERLLMSLLDADSDVSPIDELGNGLMIVGNESSSIVEGLGVLCFTPLLRVARSGVDPSSLLSEDADSVILAAASDLVSKIVKRWIDVQTAADCE